MASKKITVTDLDFDTIKQNLKTYLNNQTTFQDYDFEGSGLSVLLDILAYNTHYNALYNNLSINEMFLDSARKRNSVVSKAKELGYVPRSAKSAYALVNVTFTSTNPTTFSIPTFTPFSTIINDTTYNFYNESLISTNVTGTSYTFTNVKIVEKKTILSKTYTAASGLKYIIPNANVDTDSIKVTVDTVPYSLVDNVVNVESTSLVYWVKEIDDNLYEIQFGDDAIGKALTNGDFVVISYAVSSMAAANNAKVFSYGGTLGTNVSCTVSTVSAAVNGDYPEDIESIRFNAPRAYATQNRGVTTSDYKALIYSNFSAAKSVSVWGGEDNIPPVYGKTFICVKPKDTNILTIAQKDYILNTILPSKNVLTITPEIVDPEYINIILTTTVYYNELLTNRTADTLKSIVLDTILNYDSTELQTFDGVFRHSKLSRLIDTCENSIINNVTTITLKRYVTPKYNINANYTINLINPIYYSKVPEDMVLSSGFYIQGSQDIHYLVDDGIGNMTLFTVNAAGAREIKNPAIGTVDYQSGIITINKLNISALTSDYFTFYIKPDSNDVVSALSQIVQISQNDLTINMISDKTVNGDLRAGQNYTFTTSRI